MNNSCRVFEPAFFSYTHTDSFNMQNTHFHDTCEIYYLLSGSRRHLINHEIFDMFPGDLILIPPMTIHRTLNVPDHPNDKTHSRYLLCPTENMIPDIFLPLFKTHHFHIPESNREAVLECFKNISQNCSCNDIYSSHDNRANLIRLLTITARSQSAQKINTSFSNPTMQKAAQYIKDNCQQPLTLTSIAKHFGYSKEYFSTLFKTSTNFGFNDYLNQMRISKASSLLLYSNLPISKISTMCGFSDSNYFASVFKKVIGISPSEFRHHKR